MQPRMSQATHHCTKNSTSPSSHYAEITCSSSIFMGALKFLAVQIPVRIKQFFLGKKLPEKILTISCIVLLGLIVYFYALYCTLIICGFAFGYFSCAPDISADVIYFVHKKVMHELFTPHCRMCHQQTLKSHLEEEKTVKLLFPNPLHDKIIRILELLIRDFIDDWYLQLNKSSRDRRFQDALTKAFKGVLNYLAEIIQ